MTGGAKVWGPHLVVIALLAGAQFVLPSYHVTNMARIMVLAVFAMGYNIAYGYTGLLSLGHALFFAAGMYGCGLAWYLLEWSALPSLLLGVLAGAGAAAVVGMLALRTTGVAFMIVTLMFAQAGYLTILYFGRFTGGDEGFVIMAGGRQLFGADLAADGPRYLAALCLFSGAMLANLWLVRTRFGRVMVSMRENAERSRMLGHDPFAVRLAALVISGLYAGAAGAFYGVLFGYVGASFATIQYSILALLWVLLGGAGTVLGPLLGVVVMFYLVDISGSYTDATLLVVGVALLALILFAPKGILGTLRDKGVRWLP